jgi:hypothetical protein
MKKLLFLMAFLTMVISTYAQTSGGLKAGLNLSSYNGYPGTVKLKPGFHVGGYLSIGLSEKLSFQPELLFSTAGAKAEEHESGVGFSYEITDKLAYLSIPLSLQYSFGKFNLHAGPQVSFLMSAKEEYTESYFDGVDTFTESGEDDIKEHLKGVDMGLNFGAGYSFGKLGVTARYSLGLSNISEEAEEEAYKLSNYAFQFSVLYKLFGKE